MRLNKLSSGRICIAVLAVGAIAACGTQSAGQTGPGSSASGSPVASPGAYPITSLCGTVITRDVAGDDIVDLTLGARAQTIETTTTSEGGIVVRVAKGCSQGATISWSPLSAARLVKAIRAANGSDIGAILQPTSADAHFSIIAKRHGRVVARGRVAL
jgi:hypothetical protein